MKLKITAAICALVIATSAQAYVTPRIGGGQTTGYPMIMPEIYFDGQSILVLDESGYDFVTLDWSAAPVLRPLIPPAEFAPTAPWAILGYKPYNFQYGWDSGLLDETTHPFPPNSGVWVKVLEQTPELETYYKDNAYAPIFGTLNSPNIWYWDKGMRHNTYAVPPDFYGRVYAVYKVYIGNISTGAELVDVGGNPLYGSSITTFTWMRPCPYVLTGDINSDCIVDMFDLDIMAGQWLNTCSSAAPAWCDGADIEQSGRVNFIDFAKLADNWLKDCLATPGNPACVPR